MGIVARRTRESFTALETPALPHVFDLIGHVIAFQAFSLQRTKVVLKFVARLKAKQRRVAEDAVGMALGTNINLAVTSERGRIDQSFAGLRIRVRAMKVNMFAAWTVAALACDAK